MNHIECSFKLNPYYPYNEILIAELSELGFESFVEGKDQVLAYISKNDFKANELSKLSLHQFSELQFSIETKEIPKENWNKKWEESFQPVEVEDFCVVRAPFHKISKKFQHEIIIEPKMSFGTGHHDTTQLMIKSLKGKNLKGKSLLDMGSGTGILAILAQQLQAKTIHAVDVEDWAYENMLENFERNNCPQIRAHLGGVEKLEEINQPFDYILANINKNILLRDMPAYMKFLAAEGTIVLSGFFPMDADEIKTEVQKYSAKFLEQLNQGDWTCMLFIKS